jgi:hypothetical protein
MKKSNKKNDCYIIKSKSINEFISVRLIRSNHINKKRECKTEICYEGNSKIVIYVINEPIITIPNAYFPSIEKIIHELNKSPNPHKSKDADNYPDDIFNMVIQSIFTWKKNNYNSQILDYRISLPLLRKLRDVGDTKFQIILQQEILWNYRQGNHQVKEYLENEGYLELIGDFF